MKRWLRFPALPVMALLAVVLGLMATGVFAENIDPASDNSQFAWGENAGWLNAEPNGNGGPGITVGNSALTGYLWGENIGWISLSCANKGSCGAVNYGVTNNGSGVLSGYAWGENAGWISFSCANTGTCGTVSYGVTINTSTAIFNGHAWGENIGWISFSDTSPVAYQVRTGWSAGGGDTDGDGCPDVKEQQTADGTQTFGGRRDYLNQWDYFNPTHDGINRTDDITRVILHYGHDASPPGDPLYSTDYDRTPLTGGHRWQFGPPSGTIRTFDITAAVLSYGHDCS